MQIAGTAAGGTVTFGSIGHPKPLTVQTAAGDTAAQVAAKLADAHQRDPDSSPFADVTVVEGTAILATQGGGDEFLRTTDSGLETLAVPSNLTAVASKANSKVTLSWTAPSPAPDEIVVWRQHSALHLLPGTATSFEDTDFGGHRVRAFRLMYTISCQDSVAGSEAVRVSDYVEILSDNPEYMEDDTFMIMTTQEWIPDGVRGREYEALIDKNGGTSPVSWSIAAGALPDGLTLGMDRLDAEISGTPSATGTWSFTLCVTDAGGATAAGQFTISVTERPVLEE